MVAFEQGVGGMEGEGEVVWVVERVMEGEGEADCVGVPGPLIVVDGLVLVEPDTVG